MALQSRVKAQAITQLESGAKSLLQLRDAIDAPFVIILGVLAPLIEAGLVVTYKRDGDQFFILPGNPV